MDRIHKKFGTCRVLEDISFTIIPGEILGLIGPNGAGKSTLLECITGLLPLESGTISRQGKNLAPEQRQQLFWYQPDDILPFAGQQVITTLSFFRQVHGTSETDLEQLIDGLNLSSTLNKPLRKLSKGFRRRVLLAIALLSRQTQSFGMASTAMAAETGNTAEQAATGNSGSILFNFSGETVGAPPKSFTAAVGNWIIGKDGNNTVLVVDGRKWKRGIASAGLADKARALYGKRYAEFLDNVTSYAYYPFAVAGKVKNFTNGEIKVRFKSIAGRIDQGAGILFDLKTNGDYYALRANPLENNLVLWRYKHGRRSSASWVRNVNTPSRQWHVLKLTVDGAKIKGYVNGRQYLAYHLPAPVSGRVGLWTKADSVIYFDDYQVQPRTK